MERGIFVAIDGIDGCGKGIQAKFLANHLFDRDQKNSVFLTREPYNSGYYEEIRRLLREGINPKDNAELLADLFVRDRKVHAGLIAAILRSGIHVVCDRYKYSTLAYQQTQGVPLSKLLELHKGVLIPDLAIILDTPVEIALRRIANDGNRSYKEVFEKKEFQEELRRNFLALPAILPDENIVVVDGEDSTTAVFEVIRKEVAKNGNIKAVFCHRRRG